MVIAFNTESLNGLASKDQLELLDAVDRLRLQGLDHYISLPQIIVCGDQSSGKSSVLEAISGVPFPVKSNLCTRFPTEVVLRHTAKIGVTVSIVPHSSLGLSERRRLSGFHEKLEGFDELPALIESAQVAMGISATGKAFSKDLLRVEVSGPDRPHLTIVDLPGLIHSETKQQIKSYMTQSRSIILAVVSAKNDFANQIVLKLARKADPKGNRTMGVITKPDTLIPGSGSEAMYVSLAKNNEVEFRLGWHLVKNMDSETAEEQGTALLRQRDYEEKIFFSEGIWKQLPSSIVGIQELRTKLSNVLVRQIAIELPSLIRDIETNTIACGEKLKALGVPRSTEEEQRLELLQVSQDFQSLVKASVDGTYNAAFFESAKTTTGYQQRIRAVIQNLNKSFSENLVKGGHYRVIKNDSTQSSSKMPIAITRDEFINHVQFLMGRTRARELPGLFNSMIVADLFQEQSGPWEPIVRRHIQQAWDSAKTFLDLVITHVADKDVANALLEEVFEPALKTLLATLHDKVTELLKSHREVHPITYNHQYAEAIMKINDDRRLEQNTQLVKTINGTYDLGKLVEVLSMRTEWDIERLAASEALDCMHAYYSVAMKRFTDDVAVEVIEEKLLSVLGSILSPVAVFQMSPEIVRTIAGESRESRAKRKKLTKQLEVLKWGSETCRRFAGMELNDDSSFVDSESEDDFDDTTPHEVIDGDEQDESELLKINL
ncbi:dynamin family protein [Xylariomycetidae sp. FL2044]|nr:dynamin family protein [Xylariomycetidae sp. FL2044]